MGGLKSCVALAALLVACGGGPSTGEIVDHGRVPAKPIPDAGPQPDLTPSPDSAVPDVTSGPRSIGAEQIGAALLAKHVECAGFTNDSDRSKPAAGFPLADDARVVLLPGLPRPGQPVDELQAWLGSRPAVTLIWDINVCGDEWPFDSATEWPSAGLVIRGAWLDDGRLVLEPDVFPADMNLVDVTWDGTYLSDIGELGDRGLAAFPNLRRVLATVQALLLSME